MEFLYSFQNTNLNDGSVPGKKLLNIDVEYFQLGGSQIWSDKKMDHFFGATLGGGLVFKLTKNIGLRLELRAYFATMGNSEALCGSGGQCIVVGSYLMNQADANVGLRFRF
jgi:opacity protein-like surface antigen